MKIVVLDGYTENPGDLSWDPLRELGETKIYDRTEYEDSPLIAERLRGAQVAVTNKTPISEKTMEQCPQLRLIAVMATGYNVIDVACARRRGIGVVNVPGYGTASVSQFSIALLLELCHHIGVHDASVHKGDWAKCADWCYWKYPLVELAGKTIGIIGFGRIGQAEGRIAKALGMHVLACDPYPSEEGRDIAAYTDLDTLYRNADVISLHCNLTPENTGMIDRAAIAKMKDGVMLLNTARGQLLVEEDVAAALNSGKMAGAALDVVSAEPIRADHPLLSAKNCILTPHIAWAPKESRQRIMDITAENIRTYFSGKPQNLVN